MYSFQPDGFIFIKGETAKLEYAPFSLFYCQTLEYLSHNWIRTPRPSIITKTLLPTPPLVLSKSDLDRHFSLSNALRLCKCQTLFSWAVFLEVPLASLSGVEPGGSCSCSPAAPSNTGFTSPSLHLQRGSGRYPCVPRPLAGPLNSLSLGSSSLRAVSPSSCWLCGPGVHRQPWLWLIVFLSTPTSLLLGDFSTTRMTSKCSVSSVSWPGGQQFASTAC